MTSFLACTQWQQETQVTCPFSFLTRHGVQTSTPTQSRHWRASFILSERKGGGPWRGRSSRKGLFNATQEVLGSHLNEANVNWYNMPKLQNLNCGVRGYAVFQGRTEQHSKSSENCIVMGIMAHNDIRTNAINLTEMNVCENGRLNRIGSISICKKSRKE